MTKLLLNWTLCFCLAHLLLLCSDGLCGGIQTTSASETTDEQAFEEIQDVGHRKLQSPQSTRNNNFDELLWQPKNNFIKELNFVKRAPSGFTGVRGKKDVDSSTDGDTQNNFLETSIDERWKKTPTGFYGVRGKKYEFDDMNVKARWDDIQLQQEDDDRSIILGGLIDNLAMAAANSMEQNEMNKRAPQGFNGMRGKRFRDADQNSDDVSELEKRALHNAYLGVPGQKDMDRSFYKRAAFYEKPDVIGRRLPNDFANKFVAVRGKKSGYYNFDRNPLNARQRYFLDMLPSFFYTINPKRAPSGFLGMRGKREIENLDVKNVAL